MTTELVVFLVLCPVFCLWAIAAGWMAGETAAYEDAVADWVHQRWAVRAIGGSV